MTKGPWTLERLMERVQIDHESGCWNWIGGKTNDGYGVVGRNAPHRLAHRFSYTLVVGPIPAGLQIDHLCKRPPCCNPAHLEPVTPHENMLRSTINSTLNAAKTHCKRGHEFSEENTYRTKSGRSCRICNRMLWREYETRNPGRNNHHRHKKKTNHPH